VKHALIRQYRDTYPVTLMCDTLEVSRTGFYAAEHRRVEDRPEEADDHHREGERGPVADAVPDHEHVADEGAQHEQVALREVDQLGGLVDEDEAQRHQAVDASHGEAVQGELQDRVQRGPPGFERSVRRGDPVAA